MKYFYKDHPALQAAIDRFFSELGAYNDANFGGSLSIILLGSLSRGEATWIETKDGPSMVSDIEFFTVFDEGFTGFQAFTQAMDDIAKTIFSKQGSPLFHIDNTYVCRQKLGNMERKLLTYDAKQMGKCVMGQDDVYRLPKITLENINLWDIKDILTHRMFSVLYYGLPLKNRGEEQQYRYCLAKNSLDLMTVLLVTHGQLASGFIRRLELVKQLPIDEHCKQYFEYCLSVKLGTVCEYAYTTEKMEELFLDMIKKLYKDFHIPLANTLINKKHVSRRILGIVKRAINHRHIPACGHLQSLIAHFESKTPLSHKALKNNLILNGYPL